jgi:hypothetical protein
VSQNLTQADAYFNYTFKRNKAAAEYFGMGLKETIVTAGANNPYYPSALVNNTHGWIKFPNRNYESDGGLSLVQIAQYQISTDPDPKVYWRLYEARASGNLFSQLDAKAFVHPTDYLQAPAWGKVNGTFYNTTTHTTEERVVLEGPLNIWKGLYVGEYMPFDVRPWTLKIANVGATSAAFDTSFMGKYCLDYDVSDAATLTIGTCSVTKTGLLPSAQTLRFELNDTYITFDDSQKLNIALDPYGIGLHHRAYVKIKHKPTGKYLTQKNELTDSPVGKILDFNYIGVDAPPSTYATKKKWECNLSMYHTAFQPGDIQYDITFMWNYLSREPASDFQWTGLHTKTANFTGTI